MQILQNNFSRLFLQLLQLRLLDLVTIFNVIDHHLNNKSLRFISTSFTSRLAPALAH